MQTTSPLQLPTLSFSFPCSSNLLFNLWTNLTTRNFATEIYRLARGASACFPNLCVVNPTTTPSNIPGSMMSQNKAIPACKITSRLSAAAIPVPARIPTSIEWNRCDTYPMAMPETKPFSREKVITLPINGARDGSRNPLRPSSNPSVPPTASPSIGFVTLIAFPCVRGVGFSATSFSATPFSATSFRICVHLHHAENIAFRVFAVCEVPDGRDRRFRHDVFSAGLQDRSDSAIHRIHANRVGGRGDAAGLLHHAAVDARGSFFAGGHHPVVGGTGPLVELPAEYLSVERRGTVRFCCGYFKVNDSRHSSPSLDLRAKLLTLLSTLFSAWPAWLPELLRSAVLRNLRSFRRCCREA